MAHLSNAIGILEKLEVYITGYTKDVAEIGMKAPKEASMLLESGIKYADKQIALANKEKGKSIHRFRGTDPRYTEITTLQTRVDALYQTMKADKLSYDKAEEERIVAIRDAAEAPAQLASNSTPSPSTSQDTDQQTLMVVPPPVDTEDHAAATPPPTAKVQPVAAPQSLVSDATVVATPPLTVVSEPPPVVQQTKVVALTTVDSPSTQAAVTATPVPSQPATTIDAEPIGSPSTATPVNVQPVDEANSKDEQYLDKLETKYTKYLEKLEQVTQTKAPESDIRKLLDQLIAHVKKLKEDKEDVYLLAHALQTTYYRLTDKLSSKHYQLEAHRMQGQPSTRLQILGGIMFAIGLTLALLGVVFFPALLGVAAAAGLAGVAATAVTATVVGVSSGAIAATGCGLFAKSFQQSELAKEMANIDKNLLEHPEEIIASSPA